MKIYIVTEGCYSDYHIEEVFLDKEKAYNYARLHCSGDGHVEEFDTLDNDYEIITPKIVEYYTVILTTKGELINCTKHVYEQFPNMEDFEDTFSIYNKKFFYNIVADSKEKAIKIARDKRAQYLAEMYGI